MFDFKITVQGAVDDENSLNMHIECRPSNLIIAQRLLTFAQEELWKQIQIDFDPATNTANLHPKASDSNGSGLHTMDDILRSMTDPQRGDDNGP